MTLQRTGDCYIPLWQKANTPSNPGKFQGLDRLRDGLVTNHLRKLVAVLAHTSPSDEQLPFRQGLRIIPEMHRSPIVLEDLLGEGREDVSVRTVEANPVVHLGGFRLLLMGRLVLEDPDDSPQEPEVVVGHIGRDHIPGFPIGLRVQDCFFREDRHSIAAVWRVIMIIRLASMLQIISASLCGERLFPK